jgi:hypothetical protein
VAAAADAGVVQMTSFYLDSSMSASGAQGMGNGLHMQHSEGGSGSSLLPISPIQQQQQHWLGNTNRSSKVKQRSLLDCCQHLEHCNGPFENIQQLSFKLFVCCTLLCGCLSAATCAHVACTPWLGNAMNVRACCYRANAVA